MVFIHISLVTNGAEQVFMCILAICVFMLWGICPIFCHSLHLLLLLLFKNSYWEQQVISFPTIPASSIHNGSFVPEIFHSIFHLCISQCINQGVEHECQNTIEGKKKTHNEIQSLGPPRHLCGSILEPLELSLVALWIPAVHTSRFVLSILCTSLQMTAPWVRLPVYELSGSQQLPVLLGQLHLVI